VYKLLVKYNCSVFIYSTVSGRKCDINKPHCHAMRCC